MAAPARLEPLEGRLLFSTYTVTTLGDSAGVVTPAGTGKFNATTLRAAITAANAHLGADTKSVGLAVLTQYECFPGAGPNQVEKDADRGRFPRAIEAEETEDLTV